MFKRKIYEKLLEWKNESDGQTALMIEGARRVGKPTIAEEFAKNEFVSYILIDFSITSQTVKDLFKDMCSHLYDAISLKTASTCINIKITTRFYAKPQTKQLTDSANTQLTRLLKTIQC